MIKDLQRMCLLSVAAAAVRYNYGWVSGPAIFVASLTWDCSCCEESLSQDNVSSTRSRGVLWSKAMPRQCAVERSQEKERRRAMLEAAPKGCNGLLWLMVLPAPCSLASLLSVPLPSPS